MSTIHLVRHGQASAGTHDYDRLSTLGQEQARRLGNWWKKNGFSADLAICGTLKRQKDTAMIALEAAGIELDRSTHAGLDEYNHRLVDQTHGGHLERDHPESMTFEDYVDIMQRWRDSPGLDASDESGPLETWETFSRRGWQAVQHMHERGAQPESLLVFTSGGIIANVLANVLELDFAHTVDAIWRIRNASITSLHYDGNRARLIEFNTVPHLQFEGDPELITLI